jgi:hypothetical protein
MRHRVLLLLLALTLVQTAFSGTWSQSAHTWGGSSTDQAASVALDSSGNVYVAGSTESFGAGGQDVLITKYDPSGTFLWAKTWGGPSNDYATAIKVGPDGFLYVTGFTSSFGAGWYDLILLQLDTDGNLRWGTTWGGGSYDGGHDIGFDASGNIYAVAESYSTGPCCSTAVLLKFSTTGALLQSSYYKGPATYDAGYSLTVDSSFNVIVAGISWDYSISPLHNSILLLKYAPNGNLLWQENWSTPFPGQDESWSFHALATDGSGNIYVAGRHSAHCQSSNFGVCDFDALLLKLDPNGVFLSASTWGATGTYDTAGSVVLTAGQDPLLAGVEDDYGTPLLFLLGYDAGGNLTSQSAWQGGNIQQGSASGMVLDANGTPYIASSALTNQGSWSSTSAHPGSLPNSLITNTYSVGVPSLSTARLTNSTVDQSSVGVQETGGGGADAFVSRYQAQGNAIDLSANIGNAIAQTKFWTDAKEKGLQYAVVAAWGGGPNAYSWAESNLLGAQEKGIGIGTAAYVLLNYFEDETGAYQVDRAIQAVGAAKGQLKFMAVDVEYCCGEFVNWKPLHRYNVGDAVTDPANHIQVVTQAGTSGNIEPAWNERLGGSTSEGAFGSGVVWRDTHVFFSDPATRVQWISAAVSEIQANGVTPIIYTRRDYWRYFAGNCNANPQSPSNCANLISLKLWDAEPHCGDGIVGLTPFVEFPTKYGWVARSGNQYKYSQPGCDGVTLDGISVDLDYFDPELFQ